MHTLTWLHLSDLHYCEPRTGWDADAVLEALLADFKYLGEAPRRLCPDLIFVTGDLAFGQENDALGRNLSDQFEGVHDFLNKVRKAFSREVPVKNVFLTPGNHDVNRDRVTRMQTLWLDGIEDDKEITDMIQTAGQDWGDCIRRLADYRLFLERNGYGHLLEDPKRLIYGVKREFGGKTVGVGGFNSAWSCSRKSEEERGRLWMGAKWQTSTILSKLKGVDVAISLMHHPPSWFVEREDRSFRIKLQESFRFCLHGHEHGEWVDEKTNGHATISAGACYQGSEEPNGYNMVRLDLETGAAEVWLREYKDVGAGGWVGNHLPGKTDERGVWRIGARAAHADGGPVNGGGAAPAASPSVSATVTGGGAIAQGNGARSLGNGAGYVGGDVRGPVVVGNHNVVQVGAAPDTENHGDPGLKESYLSSLLHQTCRLHLGGIDPKAATGGVDDCLDLGAVYTALLTRGSGDRGMKTGMDREREQPVSALEKLDEAPRLVLLGDPGSGKSTFVNFVGACLAGEALGDQPARLDLMRRPLPNDDGEDREEPQPWNHGALLPVRVILREFAARGLPETGETPGATHLLAFIREELRTDGLVDFFGVLRRELQDVGGLVMLDGLDEVPEAAEKRESIKRVVESFAGAFPKCRILVTSRTYAYQRQDWRLSGFSEAVLAPFSAGQIRRFIDGWYAHMADFRGLSEDDARGRAELLKRAVFGNDRIIALGERPLLLTLMASLHAWRGGSLPEKREELYHDAVELLLDLWESPKIVRDAGGRSVVQQASLSEWLRVDRKRIRESLNELAFEVHQNQADTDGTADIPAGELVGRLMDLKRNPDVNPTRLVEYLSDRAGLLVSRGDRVYAFPHRTFQEYLAACHLTDDPEYPVSLAELARTDANRWREVTLLAGAKAARGNAAGVWSLAEELCQREPEADGAGMEDAWGAHIAGQLLAESANLERVSRVNETKKGRVIQWLLAIMRGDCLPGLERAIAGRSLAVLGDPREEITTVDGMRFCPVPAGAFTMGSDKEKDPNADEDEAPKHDLELPLFYMAKFPVSAAQFAEFVRADGYGEEQYWPEAIRNGEWKDGKIRDWFSGGFRDHPHDFGSPFNLPNHPVVGVTWYEAMAFSRWLTAKWRDAGLFPEGWHVALPTEAQWEKAARGGAVIPIAHCYEGVNGIFQSPVPGMMRNPVPDRIFSWEAFALNDACNSRESEIGSTSSLGCFSTGKSPYGCEELIGNMWEWSRSIFEGYPYEPNGDREDLRKIEKFTQVSFRGGCWANNEQACRCAFRSGYNPSHRFRDYGFRVALSPFL